MTVMRIVVPKVNRSVKVSPASMEGSCRIIR